MTVVDPWIMWKPWPRLEERQPPKEQQRDPKPVERQEPEVEPSRRA